MTREIKFRYWDTFDEDMKLFDPYLCAPLLADQSSPLMEYTGLKDKYGKDIYEGDILRLNTRNTILQPVTIPGVYELLWTGEVDFTEVIGNIYENPELLEN